MRNSLKIHICLAFIFISNRSEGIKVLRNELTIEDKGLLGGGTISNPQIFENDFDAMTICIRFKLTNLMATFRYGLARILTIGNFPKTDCI